MKHTPGPVAASRNEGPYPICVVEHENADLNWYVNAPGAVREEPEDDAKFIAWCYNNAPVVEASPDLLAALEAIVDDPTQGEWVWCTCEIPTHEDTCPIGHAVAVIAKAKGEET